MNDLARVHDIEIVLLDFYKGDLYTSSLKLYKVLDFPIIPLKNTVNQSINDFLYFTLKNVVLSTDEIEVLKEIKSISILFNLNQDFFGTNTRKEKILFLSIEFYSSKKDRSINAHYITKIMSKIYKVPIFILFFHEECILFSGLIYLTESQKVEVFLSDWFTCSNLNFDSIITLSALAYENHSFNNIYNFYSDITFSISRKYYIYPESHEYLTYGTICNELSYIHNNELISLEELTCANFKYYQEIYGYDFIDNNESLEIFNEKDNLLIDFLEEDFISHFIEVEPEKEDSDEFEDEIDLEIDDNIFEDPIKLLEWLDE